MSDKLIHRQKKYERIGTLCDEIAKKIQDTKASQEKLLQEVHAAAKALEMLEKEIVSEPSLQKNLEKLSNAFNDLNLFIKEKPETILKLIVQFKNNLWEL